MVCKLVFTAAMSIPIFNTPRLVALSLPRSGSRRTIDHAELGTNGVVSCRDVTGERVYYIKGGLHLPSPLRRNFTFASCPSASWVSTFSQFSAI